MVERAPETCVADHDGTPPRADIPLAHEGACEGGSKVVLLSRWASLVRSLFHRRLPVAAVLVSLIVGVIAAWLRPRPGCVLNGVSVAGIAIGGLTEQAAARRLAESLNPRLKRSLWLVDGPLAWEVTPAILGCTFDVEATVAEAMACGRRGSLLRRWSEIWQAHWRGLMLKPRHRFDRDVLARCLRRIAEEAHVPARDAQIRFDGRQFHITEERMGHVVDAEATEKNIVRYLDPLTHQRVTLVSRVEVPRLRAEDLRRINGRLASYTTRFNPGDVNRTANLRLAARALDGAVVPAGAVFSYNERVGPRSEKLGYRVAKIFRRGEILDGVGGGVCQVASTLYNAALESGLRIVERRRHSRPVPYVPPGRDATVSYGGVDLKFYNHTDAPILIQATTGRNTLTVSLYGNRHFTQNGRLRLVGRAGHRARAAGKNHPDLAEKAVAVYVPAQ